jgi:IclR helix-turn-helix domain
MAEQPINLYLGVFSRAEQRVLQAIFKAIAEGGGECLATLTMLARDSNTSKSTTRNAIARAVEIGLLEKAERRSCCAVSLPNILTYGKPDNRAANVDSISTVRNHQRFQPRPTNRPFSIPQINLAEAVTDHGRPI